MKIPLNDTQLVYEKIIKGINVAEGSIVLFVALDVDALCTFRILSVYSTLILDLFQKLEYRVQNLSSHLVYWTWIEDLRLQMLLENKVVFLH